MRTSLTRAVAGVAIAAAAVAAAVGVAGVASAGTATKGTTTLSIVEARTTITVGQVDTISGVLKSHATPLAHRIIILDRLADKKWRPIEEKFTGKFGGVAFAVAPRSTASYKLVFPGGEFYYGTHSGTVVVHVKPVVVKTPTSLSITESATSITVGQTDTISGALTATATATALPRQWVWLAVVSNGKVHPLRAFLTGKLGKVAFTVKPAATTTYELLYLGTRVLAHTASGTVITTVTPPPASA